MPDIPRLQQEAFWRLATFAARYCPYYARQDWARRIGSGGQPDSAEIPILTKDDICDKGAAIVATTRASGHETRRVSYTSGSTGIPLKVLKSARQRKIEHGENTALIQFLV